MEARAGEKCPICHKELYSITTRQIIGQSICRDCGDKISPLVDALNDKLFIRIKYCIDRGESLTEILYAFGQNEKVDKVTMAILQGQK